MGDSGVVYVVGCLGFNFLDWLSRMRMGEDIQVEVITVIMIIVR